MEIFMWVVLLVIFGAFSFVRIKESEVRTWPTKVIAFVAIIRVAAIVGFLWSAGEIVLGVVKLLVQIIRG